MKRIILMVCAALVALVACEKQPIENPVNEGSEIVFNLTATHPEDTKAVKTGWETNDVIFVFFSGQAAPKYLEMKWNGTAWVNTEKNSLALAESETGTMRAVYLPFDSDAIVNDDGAGNFIFNKMSYTYYLTATLSYTVTSGEVSGSFNMQIPEGYVQFFLDDETATDPAAEIELREPNLTPQYIRSISANCSTVNVFTQAHGAPIDGYLYDKESKATGEKKGWLFSGILAASARNAKTNYHFTLVKGGWQGNYYSKAFSGEKLYTGDASDRAVKLPALTSWTAITDYKPIDMNCEYNGKRIYWASRNVGATSDFPTADTDAARHATWGDYFAWGETAPYYAAGHAYDNDCTNWAAGKTGYNWASYQWETAGDGTKFSKYTADKDSYATNGTADGLTVLEAADDAANANLGGIWRMPTYYEWGVLRDNYDWTWDDTNKGRVVTIKDGTAWTDPTIFLPAAGCRSGQSLTASAGNTALYWYSDLDTTTPNEAYHLDAGKDYVHHKSYYNRFYGLTIRAITD